MTQDDVLRLVRQVQKDCELSEEGYTLWSHKALIAFAELAIAEGRAEFAVHAVDIARRSVAEERESCAKIADEWAVGWPHPSTVIAERIRARGEVCMKIFLQK